MIGVLNKEKIKSDIEDDFFNYPLEFKNIKNELENTLNKDDIDTINNKVLTDITYEQITKEQKQLTNEESKEIFNYFKNNNYIDNKGKIKVEMKEDIIKDTLILQISLKMQEKIL